MIKLCPCPVKYRHKVITDTLNPCLGYPADIFTVIVNIAISGRFAKLDIFMYRNTFNYFKMKPCILCLLL